MSVSQYAAAADLIGKKPFDDDADLTPAQQTLQCQFYESRWQRGIADVTASTFAQKMYLQWMLWSYLSLGREWLLK